MESLGERIKYCRKLLGKTQDSFAELLGFESKVVVSNWENNNRVPEVSTLITIAQLVDASLDWLLLGKGKEPSQNSAINLSNTLPPGTDFTAGKTLRQAAKQQLKQGLGRLSRSKNFDAWNKALGIEPNNQQLSTDNEETFSTYLQLGFTEEEINIIRKMREIPEAIAIINKILTGLLDAKEGFRQLGNLSLPGDEDASHLRPAADTE